MAWYAKKIEERPKNGTYGSNDDKKELFPNIYR